MAKKTNNAHRRRIRQMTLTNPVTKGSYEQVWFDQRGNPVAAGAYDAVWSDLTGAKPAKQTSSGRRTLRPTPTVQPIAGGAVVSVEPLDSLSDAELRAKYKSVFSGRPPSRAGMIKKLQGTGEVAAAVVEPAKTVRPVTLPKVVEIKSVAPPTPSAPKREYTRIRKISDIDNLSGPFTIDADAIEKGDRKIYFFDAKGNAYVYSAKNDVAKTAVLNRLAVAETSGDVPTAKDVAAIDALGKQIDKTVPVEGNLVVLAPTQTTKKPRVGVKTAAPTEKKPATRRPKVPPAAEPSLEELMLAEIGAGEAGTAAEPSLEELMLAEITNNPRRNRNSVQNRRMLRSRRNGSLSPKELNALKQLILNKLPVDDAKADKLVAIIDKKTESAEFAGMATNKEKLQYILATINSIKGKLGTAAPATEPMAPSAEDIVSLLQNVAVSGAHEEARRAVDNADKATIKKVWKILTGGKERLPDEASARKAVLAYLDAKGSVPGVMTETGKPTETVGVDMPSDEEARAEIERRIRAKVAEMKGAPAPSKPSAGGKKQSSPAGKTPKVSAEDLAASINIDDILGNPRRRNRMVRRKVTRRNRF